MAASLCKGSTLTPGDKRLTKSEINKPRSAMLRGLYYSGTRHLAGVVFVGPCGEKA